MTIDPKVETILAKHRGLSGDDHPQWHFVGQEAMDALLSAVRTAHLQELRGETEEETLEKAVTTILRERDPGAEKNELLREDVMVVVRLVAPILTAPLRAKLQAQEARIKTLEGELRLAAMEVADRAIQNAAPLNAALDKLFGGGK